MKILWKTCISLDNISFPKTAFFVFLSELANMTDSRYVHVHADSRCCPLAVHDRHSGDDVDKGRCQASVQRPSPVSVLLCYTHLTHDFTRAGRQNVHLEKQKRDCFRTTSFCLFFIFIFIFKDCARLVQP